MLGRDALAWVLSGRGEEALRAQARDLGEHLRADNELDLADVAHSLAVGRSAFDRRAVIIGDDRERLLTGLDMLAGGEPAGNVVEGVAVPGGEGVVFVFPGQGSQWTGMALGLLDRSPVFAERLHECADALAEHVDWSLLDVLRGADGAPGLDRVDVVQPTLFAVMVSLAELWGVCGVRPSVVVGHSQGEIAAACVAGCLSLRDAARLVALRSRMLTTLVGRGEMMSVAASREHIDELLGRWGERISTAAINGPRSVVLAGDHLALAELRTVCETEGIRVRSILAGTAASHSPQVEELRDELLDVLRGITPLTGSVEFHSTVTAGLCDGTSLGPEYWYRNMREPVQFNQTVRNLLGDAPRTFVEISPHPVLSAFIKEIIDEVDAHGESFQGLDESVVVGTLRRGEGDPRRFLHSLAEAWVAGISVDWGTVTHRVGVKRVQLPTYSFQRTRHWLRVVHRSEDATHPDASGEQMQAQASAGLEDLGGPADHVDWGEDGTAERDSKRGVPGRSRLEQRLLGVPKAEYQQILLDMVRVHTAIVLGHDSPGTLELGRTFKELGFDSRAAVELRDRLKVVTGLRLATTLVFDNPTPETVAGYLLSEITDDGTNVPAAASVVRVEEPIAIVGMACRYPGGVLSPSGLWEMVASSVDAISGFPSDRGWDSDVLNDPDPDADRQGMTLTHEGGFLYDAPQFDAAFFDISPREALAMDPQQRLLLETCWEAVEDGGIDPRSLKGSQTGVFAGAGASDYGMGLSNGQGASGSVEGYRLTGSAASVISGRVAYTLGLEGPAVTVDTACSSSLVALHLACQSLREGDCSLALTCGVTVMSTPGMFIEFSRQRGLALDGRCKSFSDGADGTGWAEGVGVLLLERLSEAVDNGHRVLAVVRGSAINQDGASNGLTAPNGPSQQRVISRALANAGLSPAQVDVVEGHGTGTRLGDPIEVQALLATYGQGRAEGHPLWLGSLKSNIGHTQAAAGVGGVIKMVMAMRHGVLPCTLHVDEPSSQVDWSGGAVSLLSEERSWERNGEPRRAGVSSFGISGTNAHVILEEAPVDDALAGSAAGVDSGVFGDLVESEVERRVSGFVGLGVVPWVVSARDGVALRAQVERLGACVGGDPGLGVGDVGFSLAGRSVFGCRAVVLGGGRGELLGALVDGVGGVGGVGGVDGVGGGVFEGVVGGVGGGVAFLFSGQGAQRVGMGRGLYERFPVFRGVFDEVCERLDVLLGCSLRGVVFGVDGVVDSSVNGSLGSLDETFFTQTGLFAVEVALFRLLESLGVRPDYLLGHSVGELAAGCVAGVFSLEDACVLVAARGRLMGGLPVGGGMVAVAASEVEALESLSGFDGRVSLAAVNGPCSVVFSGDEDAVLELMGVWVQRGRRVKRLLVSHAFHSARMDGMLEEFADVARGLSFSEPLIPVVSNLTGEAVAGEELCDPEYWVRHVRETVRFADGVRWLRSKGVGVFLELGPDGVLSGMVQECVDGEVDGALDGSGVESSLGEGERDMRDLVGVQADVVVAPVLRGDRDEEKAFLGALAQAWVRGCGVDWASVFEGSGAQRVALPTYAFQRERYWLDSSRVGVGDAASVGLVSAEHPLLGAAVAVAGGGGWLFTGRVSLQSHPWLADHVVGGSVLLAGSAFLELALRAGSEVGCGVVQELVQEAPLVLGERGWVGLQVTVGEPDEFGRRSFEIYSRAEVDLDDGLGEGWARHASGVLARGELVREEVLGEWPPVGAVALEIDDLYDVLAASGLEYGPAFRGLSGVWRDGDDVFAEVSLAEGQRDDASGFLVHPVLVDTCLHALAAGSGGVVEGGAPRVPFSWGGVSLHAVGASMLRVRFSGVGRDTVSMVLADGTGMLVANVDSLVLRELSVEQLRGVGGGDLDSVYAIEWVEVGSLSGASDVSDDVLGGVVVLGREGGELASGLFGVGVFGDVASLRLAVEGGLALPGVVLLDCTEGAQDGTVLGGVSSGVCEGVVGVLGSLQEWLADERLVGCRLVVVTSGAVAAHPGEGVSDLVGGAVWGLVRSAQSENPGRFVLFDVDDAAAVPLVVLEGVLACGEDQVVVRDGRVFGARLARAGSELGLRAPLDVSEWCLRAGEDGSLDGLSLVATDDAGRVLGEGEVRVGVRAAGLNFRDVLIALGVYPERASVGGEGAGVVLEVGPGVVGFQPGDRVMGLLDEAFGPVAVADHRLLAGVPDGWSFAQAASVPIVFLTAYYALVDLAGVRKGERLLVHAGAGGVGMAAIQLADHLGVEVFATASPGKWSVLRGMGLAEERISSSRTLEFAERFGEIAGQGGIDVVLDCLAGEFVDASLGLLGDGGRFVEMGKTDIRDPAEVSDAHPGVSYRAFDVLEAGPERIQEMLGELSVLFGEGALRTLPVTGWDVRHAREAFRFMSQARHVGKNVLTLPVPIDRSSGTVLITGGTGGLGALLAEHLVSVHGTRRLLLTSRRGLDSEGAGALSRRLSDLGAEVEILSCDVSDKTQVKGLLDGIDPEHPLSMIVHAAGVLDDGVLESLTPERVSSVLSPKVDGAWNLHELTRGMDLAAFVLFSSIAGSLGSPGQANYAAANSFLDALAAQRRAQGLPAVSLAWGAWTNVDGMADSLGEIDSARIEGSGITSLTPETGLEIFDSAHDLPEALVLAVKLNTGVLTRQAAQGELPPLLGGLIRTATPRAGHTTNSLAQRLTGHTRDESERIVLELIQTHAAAVLGHTSPQAIQPTRIFKDLGFDSLAGIELRNRLTNNTGLRLPASIAFDHPTPHALTQFLLNHLPGESSSGNMSVEAELAQVEGRLSALAADGVARATVAARLHSFLSRLGYAEAPVGDDDDVRSATAEEVFDLIDRELGSEQEGDAYELGGVGGDGHV